VEGTLGVLPSTSPCGSIRYAMDLYAYDLGIEGDSRKHNR
jgi:hypothetical protein